MDMTTTTTAEKLTYKPCLEFCKFFFQVKNKKIIFKEKKIIFLAHDNYSENEYCKVAWPALEQVLHTFLNLRPGQYIPIKFEEMYW